jgi:2-dehydro-3-deoxygluconokinase
MLKIRERRDCEWDLMSLGEVMLRFDPGDERIHTARHFRVWEGGGEYNVARNLSKCFRQKTAIATALADNQIGRLVEDLIMQGGVDVSNILWRKTDGASRAVRNGMYFMERGFGLRDPAGCSDRGNTAVSQVSAGDFDWDSIFSNRGARWFHCGGIFAGLSETTAKVAEEAMIAAKESGAIVSYDLNYRESLWADRGGLGAANELNRVLLQHADMVFGVEDFQAASDAFSSVAFEKACAEMSERHPNLCVLAATLRDISSSSCHNISGACYADGKVYKARAYKDVEVLDRVGSGDAFASGFIFGMLSGEAFQQAIEVAAASAALSLACPGDGLTSTLSEIQRLVSSDSRKVFR